MTRSILCICIVVFACSTAGGATYQWTDDKGVVHFTDDDKKVPRKYRNRLIVLPGTGSEGPSPGGGGGGANSRDSQDDRPVSDRTEQWWRAQFQAVHRELKLAQDRLVAKKEQQSDLHRKRTLYHRARDRHSYDAISSEITREEDTVKGIQVRLDELHQSADLAGVPSQWRE